MKTPTCRRSLGLAALIFSMSIGPQIASATIVEFDTVVGTFQVNLYDNDTPETVANFLDYVNSGAYNGSIYHRSVPGFIVQGGGFFLDTQSFQVNSIPANPAVVNEPVFANVRGTISMAKLGGDPNSATNQWFFNLADNSGGANGLDTQNGGFTAFGEVVGNGMDVLDEIAALPRSDLNGAFTEIPLRGDRSNDPLDETNYVIVNSVTIFDSTVDSAAGLNPPLSTAGSGGGTLPPPSSGGGGGGLGFLTLLGLLVVNRKNRQPFTT
ncbi:MAG: peptidylprolyl isomerase [Gammaproteobacteria bacterium]|nr:peptidylprolyl isomerase [Gammaproteobacteria bacterium]